VDGIVFWSKNPAPMLPNLTDLDQYRFYFQFTLTPYGPDIEPGLPAKAEILDTFRRLADKIGPERVIWRYDPILLNPIYTESRHIDLFGSFASFLQGFTRKCTVSFIDLYRNTSVHASRLQLLEINMGTKNRLAAELARIAANCGMELSSCAEEALDVPGVSHARCVDARLFNALWGLNLPVRKDRNQRPACGCTESVDIGAYNTCPAGCLYCYANYNPKMVEVNRGRHETEGEFLIGG
jgi:hypothetical protein